MKDDRELVEAFLEGDSGAFAALVDRYRYPIYGLCFGYTRDYDAAEDAAQEAFVTTFLKLQELDDPDRFRPWLQRIAANECRKWMRTQRRYVPLSEVNESFLIVPTRSPEDEIVAWENRQAVWEAIGRLTEPQQQVVTLFYLENMSLKQIADALGASVQTVNQRLYRARLRLKEEMLTVEETLVSIGYTQERRRKMAEIDEQAIEKEVQKAKLGDLVEKCLAEAVRQRASDIHIVPKEGDCTEFYFRIDGKLVPWHRQERTKPEAVAAVVKDRSVNMDRLQRSRVQDGFIQRMIEGEPIRFRVSVLPVVLRDVLRRYERIAIRLLDDRKVITDLNKLALQERPRADLDEAMAQPQGLILVVGPTGSGKTTTMVAALHQVMDLSLCVLTLEDPVEYLIEGASQARISPEAPYDEIVSALLRHDPDVVMLGEVRDRYAAELAMKLAITGHLVFSVLHTEDAVGAVARLLRMGVQPTLVAGAINLVLAQKLVRVLCEKCKAPVQQPDESAALALGFTKEEMAQTTFYQAVGCDACRGGYKGRAVIHESLAFTKAFRGFVKGCSPEIDEEAMRKKALEAGMFTFAESAKGRLKDGVTSLEEMAAAMAEIAPAWEK